MSGYTETAYHKAGTRKASLRMEQVRDAKWKIRRHILTGFLRRSYPNDWARMLEEMNTITAGHKEAVSHLEGILADQMDVIREFY